MPTLALEGLNRAPLVKGTWPVKMYAFAHHLCCAAHVKYQKMNFADHGHHVLHKIHHPLVPYAWSLSPDYTVPQTGSKEYWFEYARLAQSP